MPWFSKTDYVVVFLRYEALEDLEADQDCVSKGRLSDAGFG
jgi:hypothetical protein